jgi:hypothetical protein
MALVSDYGDYGILPPIGKGFYLKLPMKDFKEAKTLYFEKKQAYSKAQRAGYLNAGGQQTFSF